MKVMNLYYRNDDEKGRCQQTHEKIFGFVSLKTNIFLSETKIQKIKKIRLNLFFISVTKILTSLYQCEYNWPSNCQNPQTGMCKPKSA